MNTKQSGAFMTVAEQRATGSNEDPGDRAIRNLAERAVKAARAELRGERAGILGAIGPATLAPAARAKTVPDRWSVIHVMDRMEEAFRILGRLPMPTRPRGYINSMPTYLALEPGNLTHLYQAAFLFGVVGIGLQLPASAFDQTDAAKPWEVVPQSPNAGGHYVPLVGRRADGLHVVTWGAIQVMTENFLQTYCDEAITYVSRECLVAQKSPEGFDYAALLSDLAALA
jgi:hypothetical protein